MDVNDNQQEELIQKQRMEAVKKVALLRFMTKDARERLSRLRVVKPQLVESVELAIMQALQTGSIKEAVTDEQLKRLLEQTIQQKEYNLKLFKKR